MSGQTAVAVPPLSESVRQGYKEWGADVVRDEPDAMKIVFATKANTFTVGVVLLDLCQGRTVTGHTLEQHGGVLHATIKFAPQDGQEAKHPFPQPPL